MDSARARRMRKRNARKGRVAPMNMISLMDIFTILVFFLLVNSEAVETVPSNLELPQAVEDTPAGDTVTVMITRDDIFLDDKRITSMRAATRAESGIVPLVRALNDDVAALVIPGTDGQITRGPITILADQTVPYSLIKKVMQACAEADYAKISLAVVQNTEAPAGAALGEAS